MLACTDASSPSPTASVVVAPDSVVAHGGDTLHFTAAVLDAHGTPVPGRTVTWSSSDTSVVAVGSAGIAIARAAGVAWVRASADGIADSAYVAVQVPHLSLELLIGRQP